MKRYAGPFGEPFAMLTQTVIRDRALSAQARLVYAELVLRSFVEAFGQDDVDVAHGEIAEVLGIGESSVRRYVRELVQAGYVESIRRGRNLPNAYRIRFVETRGNAQSDGSGTLESSGRNARSERSHTLSKKREDSADRKERDRDPVFDALVELFGPPPRASLYGKRCREIRAVVSALSWLDLREQPAAALRAPADLTGLDWKRIVLAAGAALRREWGVARVTVNSLVENFGLALQLAGVSKVARASTLSDVDRDDPEYGAV